MKRFLALSILALGCALPATPQERPFFRFFWIGSRTPTHAKVGQRVDALVIVRRTVREDELFTVTSSEPLVAAVPSSIAGQSSDTISFHITTHRLGRKAKERKIWITVSNGTESIRRFFFVRQGAQRR